MLGLLLSLLLGSFQETPPGLRLVAGGPTRIGSTVADVERWMRAGERSFAPFLAGETPQFTAEVADFWLMTTEVTQEQYAAYVTATAAKPPHSFGAAAVERARAAFLEAEALREPEAARRRAWEPATWWDAHWTESEWALPAAGLALPVTNVSQVEARAYARWAGLRLMDEAEFARACRDDTDRLYPWGDDWDEAACNSIYFEPGGPTPVGSFPAAPSASGLFDLAGNAWEWTRSHYKPFPGYAPIEVTQRGAGRELVVEALAPFAPRERVVVGGSFLQQEVGLHVASRRARPPTERVDSLGFRCALSAVPGLDVAEAVIANEIRSSFLPAGVEFDVRRTAFDQSWSSVPGTAGVPGYAVITAYERVLFCPVRFLPVATRVALERHSSGAYPGLLGFLSTSRALAEPVLDAGTYLVFWRPPGKVAELDPLASVPGLEIDASCLVFYGMGGLPLAAVRASHWSFGRLAGPSTVTADPDGALHFTLAIPGTRREGLAVELELLQNR